LPLSTLQNYLSDQIQVEKTQIDHPAFQEAERLAKKAIRKTLLNQKETKPQKNFTVRLEKYYMINAGYLGRNKN